MVGISEEGILLLHYTYCNLYCLGIHTCDPVGIAAPIYLIRSIPWRSGVPIMVWLAFWFLSVFTLMPAEIPENTSLVITSGVVIMIIGGVAKYLDRCAGDDKYWLSLHTDDLKRPMLPMLFHLQMVFFNVAFFGTGNFASIASFEISLVYRFITIFSPFFMAALLIFKLLIPFMLVICTFSALTKVIRVPLLGCYFLVILCSDVMTIHFFFLVRNTGSWMEIGNSISHFGIMSAQVVFGLTNVYTRESQTKPAPRLSRKAI